MEASRAAIRSVKVDENPGDAILLTRTAIKFVSIYRHKIMKIELRMM
jgi:hypothetical protein